jgi:hypothetical protein
MPLPLLVTCSYSACSQTLSQTIFVHWVAHLLWVSIDWIYLNTSQKAEKTELREIWKAHRSSALLLGFAILNLSLSLRNLSWAHYPEGGVTSKNRNGKSSHGSPSWERERERDRETESTNVHTCSKFRASQYLCCRIKRQWKCWTDYAAITEQSTVPLVSLLSPETECQGG